MFRLVSSTSGWAAAHTAAGETETGLGLELTARRGGGRKPERLIFVLQPSEWLTLLARLLQPVLPADAIPDVLMTFAQAAEAVRGEDETGVPRWAPHHHEGQA
jgi:hypothetical protein